MIRIVITKEDVSVYSPLEGEEGGNCYSLESDGDIKYEEGVNPPEEWSDDFGGQDYSPIYEFNEEEIKGVLLTLREIALSRLANN